MQSDPITQSLHDVLPEIRPDVRGIFDVIQDIKPVTIDSLIVQACFAHYPLLFKQLASGVEVMVIMTRLERERIALLESYYKKNPQELVLTLFGMDDSACGYGFRPPAVSELEPLLHYRAELATVSNKVVQFLHQCIISHYVSLNPLEVVKGALDGSNPDFCSLTLQFTFEQACRLINMIPPSAYHRRLEYEINQRVYERYSYLRDLEMIDEIELSD